MLSLSSLIEFLLDMLRDEATQNDFARDPNGTLAARGLEGVTAQDVHDVRPVLADHGAVRHADAGHGARFVRGDDDGGHVTRGVLHGHGGGAGHGDPVRAIQQVTHEYHVDRSTQVQHVTQEYQQYSTFNDYHLTDRSVHTGDNSTVVQDSFNQDNDGVDNKGGVIDDSVVAGGDADGSGNETDVTVVDDSYNDATTVTDSLNSSTSEDHTDVGNDRSTHVEDSFDTDRSTTIDDSFSGSTVNDSYSTHASGPGGGPDDREPVGSESH